MSEQDETPMPARASTMAWARVEAKLDVAIAQTTMWREETNRRLAEHDALHARTSETLSTIQQRLAAADAASAAEAAAKPPKVGLAGWLGIAFGVLATLYLILDHTPGT